MTTFLFTTAIVAGLELGLGLLLFLLPRAGPPGRALTEIAARAPLLDLVVAVMTWIPWLAAGLADGWRGFASAVAGQVLAMCVWVLGHETIHRRPERGPRLGKTHARLVGRWRNLTALWFSLLGVPVLWGIRFGEMILYPPLCWLMGFPSYRQSEWVNVSRQKFQGLVGHDLIWCLYCDWMTGVYALGGEMLRNIESFWCPIRFYDDKKCANCRVEFPDIDGGWVSAQGTMADVQETVLRFYADGHREWFGHPARLTIEGRRAEENVKDQPG